jgi:hypothetical protein
MTHNKISSLHVSVAATIMLGAGAALAEESIGEQAAEKYQGFAEKNPALTDDRGHRLQKPGEQDTAVEAAAAGADVYPDEVVEGNEPLTPDLEDQPGPYSEEAEVHGEFGDDNPDLQR